MVRTRDQGRHYSGLAPAERARRRHESFLAAALELFGTDGYPPTTVKRICKEAGLTERYFYASFKDRHDCLVQLYTDLTAGLRAVTLAAIEQAPPGDLDAAADAGLAAFVGFLTRDPRRARVVLIEVVGVSAELEARRHGVLREFAELITTVWSGTGPPGEARRLTAVGLVGAVNHLLVDWLLSERATPPETLVGVCSTLFSAAHTRLA
ncbi:TetR/AcrR family transcriptional regulator [Actinomadura sp. NAK00032]|uniref:TetR/AcrR family transcriptional regulator n=1 Tax=Actinomadura sp. NAK00032 TaxID=2742128 RepID=UPI00158FCE21|nr:TetR/AcrR family transcriptional regulator [Actinomadura sp. NAK00032]QKW38210.1 TetR/AcrR family transcriptional regulator [Actinomadura sp. NAK00032]